MILIERGKKKMGRRKSSVSQAAHHYTQHPMWTSFAIPTSRIDNKTSTISSINTHTTLSLKETNISGKEKKTKQKKKGKNLGSHI